MKKLIALLLVAVMCLSFVACDESGNTETPPSGENTENNGGSTNDNTTNENNDDSTKDDSTTSDTVNPIDPNSPEGRAIAELDKVKGYFSAHFANNDKWYPVESDTNNWVEMTADGKFQCMYMGQPSRYWNFAWLLESYKSVFGVEGKFSHSGDDVIYTLADASASATWEDIDAFDIDAYQQSDEYKEVLKQAQIASMKAELNQFSREIQLNLAMSGNNWEISSGVFVSKDENGNLTASVGTIADAFNLYDKMNFNGTFTMDGDTLVYVNNEDNTISVTWDEAVN